MKKKIPVPKFSEFLIEEFMIPLHLDAYALSQGANIPLSEVKSILRDETEVTYDISAKLGAYFHVSDDVFHNMQVALKSRAERRNLALA